MNDIERARGVPCPGCKRPAGTRCVDLDSNTEVDGVHQVRIYRAYVVAEAVAHNRAVELEAEVERLRAQLAAVTGQAGGDPRTLIVRSVIEERFRVH